MFPNLRNIPKLFGREDTFHCHKTLGLLTTLHFLYRAALAYQSPTLDMRFTPRDPVMLAGIVFHAALSGTSLIFHLPSNRVRGAPMIWPEFRLHSILFAYRSLLVLFVYWWLPSIQWIRPFAAMNTLVIADLITNHYKKQGHLNPDQTTMRSMPFPANTPSAVISGMNFFYSTSQVFATINILYGSPEAIFITLFPIQFAAFWMTLVRKGILTAGQWHTYYALSLLSNYMYGYMRADDTYLIPTYYNRTFALLFIIGRFYYRIDKYFLWMTVILCGYLI
jgi:hypothetical protein